MADPTESGWELVMPFVVCESEGGPFNAKAFVGGWLCGRIDAQLQAMAGTLGELRFWADPVLLPQLDLIAMKHGLVMTSEPWDEHPALVVAWPRWMPWPKQGAPDA